MADPLQWWRDYGFACKTLQGVALRVLGIPSSAVSGTSPRSSWCGRPPHLPAVGPRGDVGIHLLQPAPDAATPGGGRHGPGLG